MPTTPTHPGVYIEEMPSGIRSISAVPTSITAFIGRARRGPVNKPVKVQSFAEYSGMFGGLWQPGTMSYAVRHFFQNGGSEALIVRVFNGSATRNTATLTLPTAGDGTLVLAAASPGDWGNSLRATVGQVPADRLDRLLFNLVIEELDRPGGTTAVAAEQFENLSIDPLSSRFVSTILAKQSSLVCVHTSAPIDKVPIDGAFTVANANGSAIAGNTLGGDGDAITDANIIPIDATAVASNEGIYALEAVDLFNLLCIPPPGPGNDLAAETWAKAVHFCRKRRAMVIIDPPATWTTDPGSAMGSAQHGVISLRSVVGENDASNAAVYFPRLNMPAPLSEQGTAEFAPCGAVAGIIARTDMRKGVWKAPAGPDASLSDVQALNYTVTDGENSVLNSVGLNCLRTLSPGGHFVWGSRTLAGDDMLSSEWKYLSVRRLALFIEESLSRGIQWAVFEPNEEPLWSQIRLNVGAFMHTLFRQGAFQGVKQSDAYFVKCDSETTTQNDIVLGIVNLQVGFAPLKPAEFVVIEVNQAAGQTET